MTVIAAALRALFTFTTVTAKGRRIWRRPRGSFLRWLRSADYRATNTGCWGVVGHVVGSRRMLAIAAVGYVIGIRLVLTETLIGWYLAPAVVAAGWVLASVVYHRLDTAFTAVEDGALIEGDDDPDTVPVPEPVRIPAPVRVGRPHLVVIQGGRAA